MPISEFGTYSAGHWREVRQIIERSILGAGLVSKPVWEDTDTDIIQGRIIKNLLNNPIIVCDISGLNPNVMFELGLRIAFRKPIILIADDETKIPFDTNVIEHQIYDRSLKFGSVENFITRLTNKIAYTKENTEKDSFIPYVDLFGFQGNAKASSKNADFEGYLQDKLESISSAISNLQWKIDSSTVIDEVVDQEPNLTVAGLKRHVSDVWTLGKLVRLAGMWKAGFTATEIGDALGGMSRNAVIGKAHRIGLKARSIAHTME